MRKTLICLSLAILIASFNMANANKPGSQSSSEGVLSGEHFILNIHGKQAGFTCPDLAADAYGNFIFIPESGGGHDIMLRSGAAGKPEAVKRLDVLDPCSSPFDRDPAVISLPENSRGYRVYALAQAGPKDSPFMTMAADQYGNGLIFLGLVTDQGFISASAPAAEEKGSQQLLNIGDFAVALWNSDNSGLNLLQIRFYPNV